MFIISEPDLHLPLDLAVNGVIQGPILGVMNGDVALLAGLIGNSLYIPDNRAYIDYGYHNGSCFANPRKCTNGITMSMGLKIPQNADEGDIVDTGGRSFAYGYTVSMKGSALRLTALSKMTEITFTRWPPRWHLTSGSMSPWPTCLL